MTFVPSRDPTIALSIDPANPNIPMPGVLTGMPWDTADIPFDPQYFTWTPGSDSVIVRRAGIYQIKAMSGLLADPGGLRADCQVVLELGGSDDLSAIGIASTEEFFTNANQLNVDRYRTLVANTVVRPRFNQFGSTGSCALVTGTMNFQIEKKD